MRHRHGDKTLKRVDEDPGFSGGYSWAIVRPFRMRMQSIRSAADENDFRALKSLHFEKLKGQRRGQCSMRLSGQFRLILEIAKFPEGNECVIRAIEDYHS